MLATGCIYCCAKVLQSSIAPSSIHGVLAHSKIRYLAELRHLDSLWWLARRFVSLARQAEHPVSNLLGSAREYFPNYPGTRVISTLTFSSVDFEAGGVRERRRFSLLLVYTYRITMASMLAFPAANIE